MCRRGRRHLSRHEFVSRLVSMVLLDQTLPTRKPRSASSSLGAAPRPITDADFDDLH